MKNNRHIQFLKYLSFAYLISFSHCASSNELNSIFNELYQSYGFDSEATETVRSLSKNNVIQKIPDVISLQIAKRFYEKGNLNKASSILSKIGENLPTHMLEETNLLRCHILIDSKNFQQAYNLAHPSGTTPFWAYLARYNLGTALIKDSQIDKGLQILGRIAAMEDTGGEKEAGFGWIDRPVIYTPESGQAGPRRFARYTRVVRYTAGWPCARTHAQRRWPGSARRQRGSVARKERAYSGAFNG